MSDTTPDAGPRIARALRALACSNGPAVLQVYAASSGREQRLCYRLAEPGCHAVDLLVGRGDLETLDNVADALERHAERSRLKAKRDQLKQTIAEAEAALAKLEREMSKADEDGGAA